MNRQYLYTAIWEKVLSDMLDILEVLPFYGSIALPASDFEKVGERNDYSFNLQIDHGQVTNDITRSAVARDLADVFLNNIRASIFAYNKNINIKLDKNFTLHLSAMK
ncbi:hypothetical protein SAMN05428988_5921 [Chitinophaga sp. YR573]|uniref:hypothetical protein n=1 Tax=Chitinophaga sp. YR573 TaxID=1881040 RepID=UPI0008C27716|nr:hypothetical protein [Chitinophaga sp. YR573]SEW45028.1 hypothetical protein SAMN05428988_5921 [Chitinophaga sp. YR573]